MFNSALTDELITKNSSDITNFENDILKLIYQEKTLEDISKSLNVSIFTINAYKMSIFHKLKIKDKKDLKQIVFSTNIKNE